MTEAYLQINYLDQHGRRECLDISGIPEAADSCPFFGPPTRDRESLLIKTNGRRFQWHPVISLNESAALHGSIVGFKCIPGKVLRGTEFAVCQHGLWSRWGDCLDGEIVAGNEDAQYEVPDDVLGLPVPWGYEMKVVGDKDNRRLVFQYEYGERPILQKFPPTDICIIDDLGSGYLKIKLNGVEEWLPLMDVLGWYVPNNAIIAFSCDYEKYLSGWVFSACIAGYWTPWPDCHDTDVGTRKFGFGTAIPLEYEMIVYQKEIFVEFQPKPPYHRPAQATFPPTRPCGTYDGHGYLYVRSHSTGYKDVAKFQHGVPESLIAMHGEAVQVFIQPESSEPPVPGPKDAYCNDGVITNPKKTMKPCYTWQTKSGLTCKSGGTAGQFIPIYRQEHEQRRVLALHGESMPLRITTTAFQMDGPPYTFCLNGHLIFAFRSEIPCFTVLETPKYRYVRSATLGYEDVPLDQAIPALIAIHGEPVTISCDERFTSLHGRPERKCDNGSIVPEASCLSHCLAFTHAPDVEIIEMQPVWGGVGGRVQIANYTNQIQHGARYKITCIDGRLYYPFSLIYCSRGSWVGSRPADQAVTRITSFQGPLFVGCHPRLLSGA